VGVVAQTLAYPSTHLKAFMPTVAIVGASPDPAKYSHQACLRFAQRGYSVWPIHPSATEVAGLRVFASLADLPGRPDIVCMYVNPQRGLDLLEAIVAAAPTMLWLNPGADGEPLASAARARGLRVVEACSLVVLAQGDPLVVMG
jgi:predicted CoA-binding protein